MVRLLSLALVTSTLTFSAMAKTTVLEVGAKGIEPESLDRSLVALKNRIVRGDFVRGESLVVLIHKHPSVKEPEHNFIYNVDTSLLTKKNAEASAQTLKELMALTDQAGLKLGVVDLSYYSDAVKALGAAAPANTCLVTSKVDQASADKPRFPTSFAKKASSGVSLEEAYLASFGDALEHERSFISTPAHTAAVAQVALIRDEKNPLKVTQLNFRQRLNQISEQGCEQKINLGFDELIADIQKIQGHDPKLQEARAKFVASLERYRSMQLEAFKTFVEIGGVKSTGTRSFDSQTLDPVTGKPLFSTKLALRAFYNNETGLYAAALSQAKYRHKDDPNFVLYAKAYDEVADEIRDLQKSISAKTQAFAKKEKKLVQQFAKAISKLHDEVFERSQEFYLAHYRSAAAPTSACRDITF